MTADVAAAPRWDAHQVSKSSEWDRFGKESVGLYVSGRDDASMIRITTLGLVVGSWLDRRSRRSPCGCDGESVRQPVVPRPPPFIMVIDDDDDLRAIMCASLRAAGYATRDTASGIEALAILADEAAGVGLIIVDGIMPILAGQKFIERCATTPGLSSIPVIACSADPAERLFMTASAHLHKPIRTEQLLASVHAWFRER